MILEEQISPSKYRAPKPIEYETDSRGCWNVISHKTHSTQTYPRAWRLGKKIGLHRYSYTIHKGQIPEGLVVMHQCDNRKCINPDHLSLGTVADNNRDRTEKGRSRNPHALDPAVVESIIDDPRSHAVVAREYGVHRSTVIRRRQDARRNRK